MREEIPSLEHYIPDALEIVDVSDAGNVAIAICINFRMQDDASYTEAMLSYDGFEPYVASSSNAYYESWHSRMHERGFPPGTTCVIFKPCATPTLA